jgi:hypothetical protein
LFPKDDLAIKILSGFGIFAFFPAMKFSTFVLTSVLTCCVLPFAEVRADAEINTYDSWNGVNGSGNFGNAPFTPTFGQTFTVPTDENTVLTSFTFALRASASSMLNYRPYVYAWDGSKITGPALYSGGISSYSSTSYAPVEVDTGELSLTPGAQYVAFFTLLDTDGTTIDGSFGSGSMGIHSSFSVYGGGEHVQTNTADFNNLDDTAWFPFFGLDLAFKATFIPVAVPEPSTWAMMLGGLALLGVGFRRHFIRV